MICSGNQTKISQPVIQTYGENIASITTQVFGLSSEVTDFHFELDKIIGSLKDDFFEDRTDDQILDEFENSKSNFVSEPDAELQEKLNLIDTQLNLNNLHIQIL